MWMSRYDATYVQREVFGRRGNRLSGAIEPTEKLVIIRELVKKL
jgi:hypothetical protein